MSFQPRLCALALAALMPLAASAAPVYCSDGTPHPDGLSTSNMTYGVNGPSGSAAAANDCYGVVNANDTAAALNALKWGSGWSLGAKDNIGGSDSSNTVLGITFSVVATAGKSGSWTVNGTGPGLPTTLDLIGVLKGSNNYAAFFFDNVAFDGSSGGNWSISFVNNGGRIPDLSHLSVYVRAGDPGGGTPPQAIPEPASIALAGLAMLGAGLASRRRRS